MILKIVFFLLFTTLYLLFTIPAYARPCYTAPDNSVVCPPPTPGPTPNVIQNIFGKIEPPEQLKGLLEKDPTGAGGISLFLSQLVALIYVAAAIMLLFMLLWGAWDWMTSGGDKEKLAAARDKLLHALIGIGLFAAAFAIIRVIETAFGFKITPDV